MTSKLFGLHLFGGVALLAVAAPGFAQDVASARAGSNQLAVRVIAASADKRATHLQRAPIAIDVLGVAALQDPAAQSVRAAAATDLSRPGRN